MQCEVTVAVCFKIPGSFQFGGVKPAGVEVFHFEDGACQRDVGRVHFLNGKWLAEHLGIHRGQGFRVGVVLHLIDALGIGGVDRIGACIAPIGACRLAHLGGLGAALPNEHAHAGVVPLRQQIAVRSFDLCHDNAPEGHYHIAIDLEHRIRAVA